MKNEIKKVGRPKKENALTSAEKQKKYRDEKKKKENGKIEIEAVENLIKKTKKFYEELYCKTTNPEVKNQHLAAGNAVERVLMNFEIEIKKINENRI